MKIKQLINPTGEGSIRPRDVWGRGEFGAKTVGPDKTNKGVCLVAIPGQPILAPISGVVTGGKVLGKGTLNFSFVEITKGVYKAVLRYVVVHEALQNATVEAGHSIGVAQDITGKYGYTIIPHVLFEFWIANNPTDLLEDKEIEIG